MQLKFWGVRGSIPAPGKHTVQYGGNTACIELRFNHVDRHFIVDAGSGIRALGDHLMTSAEGKPRQSADLFLTHTHLDHIIGFPFFGPLFNRQWSLNVHGPLTCEEEDLEAVLGTQLSYRFFPVRQTELAADVNYINLPEGCLDLGDGIKLRTTYLNHPLLCLAYRFEFEDKVVCTAYDTEPFTNLFSIDPFDPDASKEMVFEGAWAAAAANSRLEEFISDADVLIHDAQYTAAEYEQSRIGWGHTAIEDAIALAERARVKRLLLFHHDPQRSDEQLDRFHERYCQGRRGSDLQVEIAREGMKIEL